MNEPRYIIRKSNQPIPMDAKLDSPIWNSVPWSDRFVDLISGEPVIMDTRVKCLYDDDALYIAFRAEEPFLRAALTERDSIIFKESDLEIFIDGGDTYYELEVNALNTVYEVFYIWRDAYVKNGWRDRPEFDLLTTEARTFGGNYDRTEDHFWTGNHPRGDKFAFIHYDLPGLQTAVHLDGTLNDDSDIDSGWNLLIRLPWQGLRDLRCGNTQPPRSGETMRIGFYRFEQLRNAGQKVCFSWALEPMYVNDCHNPEKFPTVMFSE